ncbi:hypothetical protein [Microvirga yunnanensis]|uniref:hypothetical protein n=1 Tax=Microvirga yunnanensis TaxID=2953740 RepID=UPI0021C568D6|nr:hypothetical protein [Microvirga sp. HBU65207]
MSLRQVRSFDTTAGNCIEQMIYRLINSSTMQMEADVVFSRDVNDPLMISFLELVRPNQA